MLSFAGVILFLVVFFKNVPTFSTPKGTFVLMYSEGFTILGKVIFIGLLVLVSVSYVVFLLLRKRNSK